MLGNYEIVVGNGLFTLFFYPCAVFEPSCSWWSFEWGRSEGLVSLVACNWVCLMKHFLLCFDDITWTVVKTYLQDVLFVCFMHWDLLLIKIFLLFKIWPILGLSNFLTLFCYKVNSFCEHLSKCLFKWYSVYFWPELYMNKFLCC